jgi:acid phosphatase type 7
MMDAVRLGANGLMGEASGARDKVPCLLFTICLALCLSAAAAEAQSPEGTARPTPKKAPTASKRAPDTFTLVGAGDIAGCDNLPGAEATARLIEKIPGTVFAAGDLAYENGSTSDFEHCYGPTWGRFKNRTRPALGNHEYLTAHAAPYFQYWGAQAGPPAKGYYSYDLGSWHIIVLNTDCDRKDVGGCGEGAPEETWLRNDLAAHPDACVVAYGHYAMYSSGIFSWHARHTELRTFWEDLYAAHADLMLSGHEHSYERFAPQDPHGRADPEHGIRQITVGTGGRSHTLLGVPQPNSEVRNDNTYGVLKLTLAPGKYSWEFVPEKGKTFRDSGEGTCHNGSGGTK